MEIGGMDMKREVEISLLKQAVDDIKLRTDELSELIREYVDNERKRGKQAGKQAEPDIKVGDREQEGWTTEAPTEEGWYWCKIANDRLLVRIRLSTANIWCADVHHEDGRVDLYSCALNVRDALWQGPLKPGESG